MSNYIIRFKAYISESILMKIIWAHIFGSIQVPCGYLGPVWAHVGVLAEFVVGFWRSRDDKLYAEIVTFEPGHVQAVLFQLWFFSYSYSYSYLIYDFSVKVIVTVN